jgi:hypothetical protein
MFVSQIDLPTRFFRLSLKDFSCLFFCVRLAVCTNQIRSTCAPSVFLFFCCCSVLQLTLPLVHFSFFRFLLMRVSYGWLVSAHGFYGSQVTAPVPSARAGRDFSICAAVSRSDFQYRSQVQFSSPVSSALRSLLLLAVTWFQGIPQQILSSCFSLASRQGSSCPCWSWFLASQVWICLAPSGSDLVFLLLGGSFLPFSFSVSVFAVLDSRGCCKTDTLRMV